MKKVVIKNVDGNDELFETILELLLNGLDTEDSDTSDDEESHCPLEEVINCITKDIDNLQSKVADIEKAFEECKSNTNSTNIKAITNLTKKVNTLYDIVIKHSEDKYTPKSTVRGND